MLRIIGQKSSYRSGNVLRFNCIPGHRLYGERVLRCGKTGEWDAAFPTCDEVLCSNPPKIANGYAMGISNRSFNVDDVVHYRCNRGFKMRSVRSVTCSQDGSWSSMRPYCKLIECVSPVKKAHATISGNDYSYASTIRYSCDKGYRLEGVAVLQCTDTGYWNITAPNCQEIVCPIIDDFKGNIMVKLLSRKPGSLAKFSCNEGYKLNSTDSSIECGDNGEWNAPVPTCIPVLCPAELSVDHGYAVSNNRGVGDTVEFSCNAGFYLDGNSKLVCLNNGTWSGDVPQCKQVTCGAPQPIKYGNHKPQQEQYKPSSVIKYKCDDNYELHGKSTRTCRSDSTWTGPMPKCILVKCYSPNVIEHGKFLMDNTIIGSVAEYYCDEGYQLEGTATRTCSANKQWTGNDPVCGQIPCPEFADLEHGSYILETDGRRTTAKFECNTGYDLKGNAERVCQNSKIWSGVATFCKALECIKPADIISNGRMISTNYTVGMTIDYVCDDGYFVDGSTKRTCTADLEWNNTIPVCERVKCPRPIKPPNCQVDGFDFRFKEHVTYVCRNGYELVGSVRRICQADKFWSGGEPKCIQIECPDPGSIENGRILKQGTFFNNKITYQCNVGYWLVGDETRICGKDKQWSGNTPKCKQLKCEDPPEIEGAVILADDPGQPLKYKCKPGYVIENSGNLTCNKLGNFSGEPPVCRKVQCSEPPGINNGYALSDGHLCGDVVKFVCRPGYSLIGEELWKCLENGSWSGQVPRCDRVLCNPHPRLRHGTVIAADGYDFGKMLTMSCDQGYELVGDATRKCQADGEWSGDRPKCEEVTCPEPTIRNGYITVSTGSTSIKQHVLNLDKYVYGMTIDFACEKGYELIGPIHIACLHNQTWSDKIPRCERISCPEPNILNGAITAKHGFFYDREITIDCIKGYELIGDRKLYCRADQTWSKTLPACKLVTCSPPRVSNGVMKVVRSPNQGVGFPYGIILGFECERGYELLGAQEIECQANMQWSASTPICKLTLCKPPELPAELQLIEQQELYAYGYKARFMCIKEGYEKVETEDDFQCGSMGKWKGSLAKCRMMECSAPVIENGYTYSIYSRYITRFKVGVEVFFRCNDGYNIIGEKSSECRDDKTWSTEIPTCRIATCSKFTIENGNIVERGDISDYTFGTRVSIECDKGYHVHGSVSLVCLQNGNWSQTIPQCSKVVCITPHIDNGMTVIKKQQVTGRYHYEDVIDISCYHGFELIGAETIICEASGKWSNDTPSCEPVRCDQPMIENGQWNVIENLNPSTDPTRTFRFGTIILYECHEGYMMEGNVDSVCQDNAVWSSEAPNCHIVTCPELSIENAQVKTDGLTYGSNLFVHCEPNYELLGNTMLQCGSNGMWQGDAPVCVHKICSLPTVTHGRIVSRYAQSSYAYGDIVKFACDEGFVLEYDAQLICLTNRSWSMAVPKCEPVVCMPCPPRYIPNGQITSSLPDYAVESTESFPYGTNVTVQCDLGYGTQGAATFVTCLPNKKWSAKFASCEQNYCLQPYVDHAQIIGGASGTNGNYTFGDSIRFVCNTGFYIDGLSETFCEPEGIWTDPFPMCLRVSCQNPEALQHGEMFGESYLFEDTINFKCEQGYELIGSNSLRCNAKKLWQPAYPICKEIQCPMAQDIKNGQYVAEGFKYADIVRYTCHKGYEMSGDNVQHCTQNKTWNGTLPTCHRIRCPTPQPMDHSRLIGDSYFFEDRVHIECDKGFLLKGDDFIMCQSDGTWSVAQSICAIQLCHVPPVINHAVYTTTNQFVFNSTVTYKCDEGYELQGRASMHCDENGVWSSAPPLCRRIYCDAPEAIDNGRMDEGTRFASGTIVRYQCNIGFTLTGNTQRECTNDKTWTGKAPQCIIVHCSQQHGLPHGRIMRNDNKYGSVITYVCDEGYELHGPSFRTCRENGEWSKETPLCELLSCSDPVVIDHGYVIGTDYTFHSVVIYACKDNYELIGESTRTCQADRTWSGTTPQCHIKKCAPPKYSMAHGKILGDDYSAGAAITFQCDMGYRLTGSSSVVCQGGVMWSSEFPQCDRVSCGLPPIMENAIVNGNSFEYSDQIKFRCKKGYYIVGDPKVQCLATGEWSVVRARCNPISCGMPPYISHTVRTGDRFTFGDFIYYKCKEGYDMTGNNLLQCAANGKWYGDLPKCRKVSCGHAPIIPHASVIVAKTTLGHQVMYKCNRGYVLHGNPKVVCVANGTWSYADKPSCEPVDCGTPPAIANGGHKYDDTILYSDVTYFCNEGYILNGNAHSVCTPDGSWNGSMLICLPVTCPNLVAPPNGIVDSGEMNYGSDVMYQCNKGYQLIGDTLRTCQTDGTWSGQDPRCDCKLDV